MDLEHGGDGEPDRSGPRLERNDGQERDDDRLGVAVEELLAHRPDEEQSGQETGPSALTVCQPDRKGRADREERVPDDRRVEQRSQHCEQGRVAILEVLGVLAVAPVRVAVLPQVVGRALVGGQVGADRGGVDEEPGHDETRCRVQPDDDGPAPVEPGSRAHGPAVSHSRRSRTWRSSRNASHQPSACASPRARTMLG